MSRVLLTGASGFLGRHAIEALAEAGHEVHALSRAEPPAGAQDAMWHRVDLINAADAEQAVGQIAADALVHMAWYVEPGKYWQARENVVWVEATLRLLRAFIAAGGRRAVIAGTCAEYEWSLQRYREDAALAPATMYGVAKNATRLVAERLAADADVQLAWGRVFMPYGPGEPRERLLAAVVTALLAGRPAPVSQGTQVRDFIYVQDVARAFAAILDSSVQGAINVGTGRGHKIAELVALAAESIGHPELVEWGAVSQRPGDPERLLADTERLEREVGYRPTVQLREGVERTVAWWRERMA